MKYHSPFLYYLFSYSTDKLIFLVQLREMFTSVILNIFFLLAYILSFHYYFQLHMLKIFMYLRLSVFSFTISFAYKPNDYFPIDLINILFFFLMVSLQLNFRMIFRVSFRISALSSIQFFYIVGATPGFPSYPIEYISITCTFAF